MTNQEMYEKFVQQNNYLKNVAKSTGKEQMIAHIYQANTARDAIIVEREEKTITGTISDFVKAVMKGTICVSNPSALQGFNFSKLNGKKTEGKQFSSVASDEWQVEGTEHVSIVHITPYPNRKSETLAKWDCMDLSVEYTKTLEGLDKFCSKMVKKETEGKKIPKEILYEAFKRIQTWILNDDAVESYCIINGYSEEDYKYLSALQNELGIQAVNMTKTDDCGFEYSYDVKTKEGTKTYALLDESSAREEFIKIASDLIEEKGANVFGSIDRYLDVDMPYAREYLENEAQFIREEDNDLELGGYYEDYVGETDDYDWMHLTNKEREEVREKAVNGFLNKFGKDSYSFISFMYDLCQTTDWVADPQWKGHLIPKYDTLITDLGYAHLLSPYEEQLDLEIDGKTVYAFRR